MFCTDQNLRYAAKWHVTVGVDIFYTIDNHRMMFRYGIGLYILFLATTSFAFAQRPVASQISGTVTDQEGRGLEGVEIHIQEIRTRVFSNRTGQFSFNNIRSGHYTFIFTLLGYEAKSLHVDISGNQTLTVALGVAPIHLQDVQVTGVQSTHITSSRYALTDQEVTRQRGKPLGEMLSEIAGVTQLKTGASIVKPIINGLHSNRVLLLNNGIRQEGQQWGVEHAPEIDPFTADRIEVIKGAQSVRYGADALGGVIITSPSKINTQEMGGRIDAIGNTNGRGLTTNARVEGGIPAIENLGWRLQASGKAAGNLQTADYHMGNTGLREFNVSGLLQYTTGNHDVELYASHFGTDLGIFYGAHVNTVEDILANIAYGRPREDYGFTYAITSPRQRVDHDLAKIKWRYNPAGQGRIEAQYAIQQNRRKEYDLRRVVSDDVPMADMDLLSQTLDLSYRNGHHEVGVSGMLQIHNNVPGTGSTPIIPNFDNHNIGVYGLSQYHWNTFHLEYGARYDYRYFDVAGFRYDYTDVQPDGSIRQYLMTDRRHFHNVSGAVGLLYHVSPEVGLKTNLGLAWRAPSANELYSDGVHHGSGTYEIGNQDLTAERGIKWINTLNLTQESLHFTADAFVQYIHGFIYANPEPDSIRQTIRGTFPVFAYKQRDALFYGTDLSATLRLLESVDYILKGSIVRARNLTDATYLPLIPSDRLTQSVQWTSKKYEGTSVSFAHQFVAEQKRFDPASDYAFPPPAYHLLHFYASTALPVHKSNIQVNFAIENIFDMLYKDYLDRFRYHTHQPGRNITLGFSYQF